MSDHQNDSKHGNAIDLDDPRLTAYALGELDDTEAAAVAALIAESPEAAQAVNDLRTLAGKLESAFAAERDVTLSSQQRGALNARISESGVLRSNGAAPRRSWLRRYRVPVALAATVGIAATAWNIFVPSLSRSRELSSRMVQRQYTRLQQTVPTANTPALADSEKDKLDSLGYLAGGSAPAELPAASPQQRVFASLGKPLASAPARRPKLDPTVIPSSFGGPTQEERQRLETLAYLDGDADHTTDSTIDPYNGDDIRRGGRGYNTEAYDRIVENPFLTVTDQPLSTFSIDVDTASYSNMRRFLNQGMLPPPDSVRIEELINYFGYDYPVPSDDQPFSVNVEIASCPWSPGHRLAKIGLKGYEIPNDERPPSNLVFLIDVSGSMNQPNKLPLVRQSMSDLVEQLDAYDRVAIVVYAGASGLVLDSTPCDEWRSNILDAIARLTPGGSTNGAAGIELAYRIAQENFITGGVNRVILATDGDFNVGVTDRGSLLRMIEEKARGGVFLSVLGYGMGNLKDATLEQLADKGNGNYAYIDTYAEARKVLVEQMTGTLITIAKDVKIQIEFNPAVAGAYRLIGYENRILAAQDFNDDKKDAGEIGAGHTVTALYEIIPAGAEIDDPLTRPQVDALKYQAPAHTVNAGATNASNELMTVKLRYKPHNGDVSRLIEVPVTDEGSAFEEASPDFHFAAAVASFGMILRGSHYAGDMTLDAARELAQTGQRDGDEYRAEFVTLIDKARAMLR